MVRATQRLFGIASGLAEKKTTEAYY